MPTKIKMRNQRSHFVINQDSNNSIYIWNYTALNPFLFCTSGTGTDMFNDSYGHFYSIILRVKFYFILSVIQCCSTSHYSVMFISADTRVANIPLEYYSSSCPVLLVKISCSRVIRHSYDLIWASISWLTGQWPPCHRGAIKRWQRMAGGGGEADIIYKQSHIIILYQNIILIRTNIRIPNIFVSRKL